LFTDNCDPTVFRKNFVRPVIMISAFSTSVNLIVSPIKYLHRPDMVLIIKIYSLSASTSERGTDGTFPFKEPSSLIYSGLKGTNSKYIPLSVTSCIDEVSGRV